MIIVFLVDTSASMNQKFSNGMSALECTKSGIEHLVKVLRFPFDPFFLYHGGKMAQRYPWLQILILVLYGITH
jgi:hypothetical protein